VYQNRSIGQVWGSVAAREKEPSADDLERAKAGLMAQARHTGAVDEGMASMLGTAALQGLSPTAIEDSAGLVAAVSAADVRAVARRYLARRLFARSSTEGPNRRWERSRSAWASRSSRISTGARPRR
jgi:predicted Zn-dependent peptidase